MPELPEVEIVKQSLLKNIKGKTYKLNQILITQNLGYVFKFTNLGFASASISSLPDSANSPHI